MLKQIKAKEEAEAKISKIEPEFIKNLQKIVLNRFTSCKAKLAAAREAGDINAEVEAQLLISELGYKKLNLKKTKVLKKSIMLRKQRS